MARESSRSNQIAAGTIKVLMYHRITYNTMSGPGAEICIPVDLFRKQLELLKRLGFNTITLEDYRQFYRGLLPLPPKPIIITFDDGYLDTYDIAYPLLDNYGMCAVVFVVGDRTITSNVWDQGVFPHAPLLNDNHLRELYDAGFEIGSHSFSHPDLSRLKKNDLFGEIMGSRESLEDVVGAPVLSFAYPYAKLNKKVKQFVSEAGYKQSCAGYTGPQRFGKDPFEIRRIEVRQSHGVAGLVTAISAPATLVGSLSWRYRNVLRKFGIERK